MIPKYMFHYTSIDTIKKIILSQKIRFTRLDLLNDLEEGYFTIPNKDMNSLDKRKFVYCSCWNSQESENLGLWKMYTDMKGARIKIKASMFNEEMKLSELKHYFVPISKIEPISLNNRYINYPIKSIFGPLKIIYVDDITKSTTNILSDSIVNSESDKPFTMYEISLKEIGLYKSKHWEYEVEWRYKMCPNIMLAGSESAISQSIAENNPDYIDVPIVQPVEEILLAPNVSDEVYKNLFIFLSDNNVNIPLVKSRIKIKPF